MVALAKDEKNTSTYEDKNAPFLRKRASVILLLVEILTLVDCSINPTPAGTSAMLGNAICSYVIMDLAGKTLEVKQTEVTYSKNAFKAFLKSLIDFEKRYHDDEETTQVSIHPSTILSKMFETLTRKRRHRYSQEKVTLQDVEFVVSKVWAGSSALSQQRDNLVLVRWNKKMKPSIRNVVLLTKDEAQRHYDAPEGSSAFSSQFIDFVNKKLSDVATIKDT